VIEIPFWFGVLAVTAVRLRGGSRVLRYRATGRKPYSAPKHAHGGM
jgi:hypothetical protein